MSTIREIDTAQIVDAVRELCIEICYRVPVEMVELVKRFPTDRWAVENGGG